MMKQIRMLFLFAVFISAASTSKAQAPQTARVVDLKANELVKAKPGTVFRECPDCPEIIVIPAGPFTMGSPESEKVWATKHERHLNPFQMKRHSTVSRCNPSAWGNTM